MLRNGQSRTNIKTINGQPYWYEYKLSWNRKYYSFDNGANWYTTKTEAFENALKSNTLCPATQQEKEMLHAN